MIKIHALRIGRTRFEYWYDRSTRCWWAAEVDANGNQVGDADHAYTRLGIIYIIENWAPGNPLRLGSTS